MLLSISVPTYNRGKDALRLTKQLLEIQELYPEDIEIVVSNNGSTLGVEEYAEIREIQHEGFTYFEFGENQHYVGNFNQAIRLSKGDFCMLVSDEDTVIKEAVPEYLEFLRANPQLGLVRSGTKFFYNLPDEKTNIRLTAGMEAVNGFFFTGNYISGMIYNRRVVTNELIDVLADDFIQDFNNKAYYYYPHLMVDACVMLENDIYIHGTTLIDEGQANDDQEKDTVTTLPKYASAESRIEQMAGHLEFISLLNCTEGVKLKMIIITMVRTVNFIYGNYLLYASIKPDVWLYYRDLNATLGKTLLQFGGKVVNDNKDLLLEYLLAIIEREMREITG